MGLPFWEMPDRLAVGGISYPIDADFRIGIRIRQMFWEPYYQTHQMRLVDGIRRLLFFGADVGVGRETELLCAVLWYLMDGRMAEERICRRLTGDVGQAAVLSDGDTVFTYLWDMPAVYASFLDAYRIDLFSAELHLWQFDALFAALPDESAIRRTMMIRAASMDSAEDDEARALLAAQKLAVRIPDDDVLYSGCLLQNGSFLDCSFANKNKTEEELRFAETVGRRSYGENDDNGSSAAEMTQPCFEEGLIYAECRRTGSHSCGN